jgi:hypothetical protein
MKILCIIRICPKDDFIGWRTMEGWKKVIEADYLFFAEQGEYKWIAGQNIVHRPHCDNFLGKDGVYAVIEGFKNVNYEGYDKIIFCDSDLTIKGNPFVEEFDFGGIQDCDNLRHFSGQCMIFSKWVLDRMLACKRYRQLIEWFCDHQKSVADDTIFSWVCTEFVGGKHLNGYWQHEKMYHLEPK